MDTTNACQIFEHKTMSLNFTPYYTQWMPYSSNFVLLGQTPGMKGVLKFNNLNKDGIKEIHSTEFDTGFKMGTFWSSPSGSKLIILAEFSGKLVFYDLEKMSIVQSFKAHSKMINCLDGIGGWNLGSGPSEILTGGRDGAVKLWDPRQNTPVLSLEPTDKDNPPDCWCVNFGNSYNNEERIISAGYDNGDLKLFDLRKNTLIWDTNLKNGVCGIEFDRKDIKMNKLVATTLEGRCYVYDMRTYHQDFEYSSLSEKIGTATLWGVSHVRQNRDMFVSLGGDGHLRLYNYHYPNQRFINDAEGKPKGIMGNLELINEKQIAQQPIVSFDFNNDKLGLGVMCALDQTCKIIILTKLNLY